MYLQLDLVGPKDAVKDLEPRKTVGHKGLTIGRAVGNDWVIADQYVSRRHSTISYIDGTFFVQGDGTVNRFAIRRSGKIISVERREALRDHDVLLIDQYEVTVTFVDGDPPLTEDRNPFNPSENQTPALPTSADPLAPTYADLPAGRAGDPSGRGPTPDYWDATLIKTQVPARAPKSASEPPPPLAQAKPRSGATNTETPRPGWLGGPPFNLPVRTDTQFKKSVTVDRGPVKSPEFGEWPQAPAMHAALPHARDQRGHANGSFYRVWFGTNRRPRNSFHPNEGFGAESDQTLHVGSCSVRIPYTHRRGSIGSSLFKRIFVLRGDDRIRLESINALPFDRFSEELSAGQARDPEKRALLYIHGYNTTFEGAAIRAAQIGFDLGITGATAFYSWASHGALRQYLADGTAIELAEDYFLQFLQMLMKGNGIQHVDILAHSMGNRLLLRTIQTLFQLKNSNPTGAKIRHILLAAPDVDIGKFSQLSDYYKSVPEKWTTVYTCRKDLAIAASTWLVDAKRLGYEPPVYSHFGLDTVSASLIPLDWLGHGYFATARPLLDDIRAIIDHNCRPQSRNLVPVGGEPPTHWRLPLVSS